MISSPTAEIMTSGTNLYTLDTKPSLLLSGFLPEDEIEISNNIFKNIFRQEFESTRLFCWQWQPEARLVMNDKSSYNDNILDNFVRSIVGVRRDPQKPDCDISHK